MKKILLFLIITTFLSCNDSAIKKPKKFIERNQMINILYDLSVLEGLKSQITIDEKLPKPIAYIKKKYNIDSATFAQNAQYYASDLKEYKKMYLEVGERIQKEFNKLPKDTNAVKTSTGEIIKKM